MASGQLAKQQRASSAPSTGRDHDGHQTLTGTVSVQKTRAKFEQPTTSPPPKPLKKPKSKKNKLLHNFCDSLRNEVKDWTGQAKKSIPKPSVDLKEKDIQSTESLINRLESICKTNKEHFQRDFLHRVEHDPGHNVPDTISTPGKDHAWSSTQHKEDSPNKGVSPMGKPRSQNESYADQDNLERLHEENKKLQQQIRDIWTERDQKNKELQDQFHTYERKLRNADEDLKTQKADLLERDREIAQQRKRISALTLEKEEALTRLSEIAGKKLHEDNANIADLSTDIRPTKISEKFKECYDNEWTEAFEEMTEDTNCTEEAAIGKLLKMVKKTYEFCVEESYAFEKMVLGGISAFPMEQTHDKVFMMNGLEKEAISITKDLRKAVVTNVVVRLQTKFVELLNPHLSKPLGTRTELYVKKCVELTWYMVVQTPPVEIVVGIQEGQRVDKDLFSFYTRQGEYMDFPVWPCVRLHKDGPLLSKGVVQGRKTKTRALPATPVPLEEMRTQRREDNNRGKSMANSVPQNTSKDVMDRGPKQKSTNETHTAAKTQIPQYLDSNISENTFIVHQDPNDEGPNYSHRDPTEQEQYRNENGSSSRAGGKFHGIHESDKTQNAGHVVANRNARAPNNRYQSSKMNHGVQGTITPLDGHNVTKSVVNSTGAVLSPNTDSESISGKVSTTTAATVINIRSNVSEGQQKPVPRTVITPVVNSDQQRHHSKTVFQNSSENNRRTTPSRPQNSTTVSVQMHSNLRPASAMHVTNQPSRESNHTKRPASASGRSVSPLPPQQKSKKPDNSWISTHV